MYLASAGSVRAQEPESGGFGVSRWTSDEGLPSHFLTALLEGPDGYLWMQAGGLLVRFDGSTFHTVDPAETGGTVGYVTDVAVGRGDSVWVTGQSGRVGVYTRGTVSLVDSLPTTGVEIVVDASGQVWLASNEGVWVRRDARFEQVSSAPPPAAVVPFSLRLWADREGGVWYNAGPGIATHRLDRDGEWALPQALAPLVTEPARSRIWQTVREGDRLLLLDDSGTPAYEMRAAPGSVPLLVDGAGRLWVGVEGGLEVYRPGAPEPVRVDLGAPDVWVHRVLEAEGGSIWATTDEHGLFRIQEQPFRVFRTPDPERARQVLTVSRGAGGTVLAVDRAGAVMRLGGDRPEVVSPPGLPITAAFEDSRGTLWLGRGLPGSIFELVAARPEGDTLRIPVSSWPYLIREDPSEPGVLWVVGDALQRVEPYGQGTTETVVGPEWMVRDFAFGRGGDLWVAGRTGVLHLTRHGREEYRAGEGVPLGYARAVYLDRETGDAWIGTYRNGVVRIRGGEVRPVGSKDGLSEDVVSTLLPDDAGNLWMSGNRSIHRASLAELNGYLDGRVDRIHGVEYGRAAGLLNPEGSGNRGYRDPQGRLWFPTFDGVAMVEPERALALAGHPPRMVLEEVRVDGTPLPAFGRVELEPSQRRVDVRYVGIFLRDPAAVGYEVRMDPLDPDWREMGTTREVTYSNLGPGDYVFRARAISGSGVVSPEEATVALSVAPRFYETAWFPVILALALLAAFGVAWRARVGVLEVREATLSRLVEERTRELEGEQRRTRAQAEEIQALNLARSRFFANLSHELRTPLTLIMGPLQDLLSGEGVAADPLRRKVGLALESGRRLDRLVDQLLDVARMESGSVKLRLRTVDAVALLGRVAESFAPLAETTSRRLEVELPDRVVPVQVDTDQTNTILSNLLGNAFKFTEAGGQVALRARVDGDRDAPRLLIEVEDDGRGIPPEHLEHVFDRFHRVGDGASAPGAGLGLALTRDLVELHGGSVDVESRVGEGTRFTVRLPVVEVPEDADLLELDPQVRALPDAGSWRGRASSVARKDEVDLEEDRTTVLLVEDNHDLRDWMREHLAVEYRVVESADGAEALALARGLTPDVVVTDIMMPGMDGDDLCRAIKSDPELSFVPVLLVTARGSRAYRLSSLDAGADDYVVKPFDIEELLLRVRNAITSRKRLRERYERESLELPELAVAEEVDEGDDAGRLAADLRHAVLRNLADEDLDVDRMARAVSMSRATLYRKTEALLGASPMEILWGVRLEQAALWLHETEATVAEIAYGVGFKSVPHFTRRFRARFGATPSRYRRAG